jgi:hypothetical protein
MTGVLWASFLKPTGPRSLTLDPHIMPGIRDRP